MEERTGWRELKRRNEVDLLVLPRLAKSVQYGAGLSGKTLAYWACLKGKSGHRERAVGKYARAAFAKEKRNRAICPKYQIVSWERVKVSERRGVRAGAWRGKSELHSEGRQVSRR